MSGTSIVFQGSTAGTPPMTAYLHSKDGHLLTKVTENSNPLTSHVRWAMKSGIPVSDTVTTQVQPVSCSIPASSFRIDEFNNTLHMRFTLAPWTSPDGNGMTITVPVTIPPGTYPNIGSDNVGPDEGTAYEPDDEGLCARLAERIAATYRLLAQTNLPSGGVPDPFLTTLEPMKAPTPAGGTSSGLFTPAVNVVGDLNKPFADGFSGFGQLQLPAAEGGLTSMQAFTLQSGGPAVVTTAPDGSKIVTQTLTNAPYDYTTPIATTISTWITFEGVGGNVGYFTPRDLARGCSANPTSSGFVKPLDFSVIMTVYPAAGGGASNTQKILFTAASVPGSAPEQVPDPINAPSDKIIYLVDPGYKGRGSGPPGDPKELNEMYWEPLVCETTLQWKVAWTDGSLEHEAVPTTSTTHPMFAINVNPVQHKSLAAPSERGVALAFQQLNTFTAHAFPQANAGVVESRFPFDQPIPTPWYSSWEAAHNAANVAQHGTDRLHLLIPSPATEDDLLWMATAANNYDVCPTYFTGSSQTERVFTWEPVGSRVGDSAETYHTLSMNRLDNNTHDASDYVVSDDVWTWFDWSTPYVIHEADADARPNPRYIWDWGVVGQKYFIDGVHAAGTDYPGASASLLPGSSYQSCAVSRAHCTPYAPTGRPPVAEPSLAASSEDYKLAYYVQYGKQSRAPPKTLIANSSSGITADPVDNYDVSSSFMIPYFDKSEQKVRFNLFGKAKWRQFYGAKPLQYNTVVNWARFRNGNTKVNPDCQQLFGMADTDDPNHEPDTSPRVMNTSTMWGTNMTSCNITPYGMWSAHSTAMFETGVANNNDLTGYDGGDRHFPANNHDGDPFELIGSGDKHIPWHLRRSYWAEYGTPSHTATQYNAQAAVHTDSKYNVNQQGWWANDAGDGPELIAAANATTGDTEDEFYAFSPVDPDLFTMPRQGFVRSDYTDDKMCTFPFTKVELLNTKAPEYMDYFTKRLVKPSVSNILNVLGFGTEKNVTVNLAPILADGATSVQVGAMLPAERNKDRPWNITGTGDGSGSVTATNATATEAPCSILTFTGAPGATDVVDGQTVTPVLGKDPSPMTNRSIISVPGTVFNYPPVCGGIGIKRFATASNTPGALDMQDVRYCGGTEGGTVFPDPMAPDVMRGRPYAPVMPTCYWRGYVKPTGDLVKQRAMYTDEISDSDVVVCDVVAPSAPSVGNTRQQIYIAMEAANGTSLSSLSIPSKLIVQTGIIGTARLKKDERFYYEIEDVRHPTMYKTVNIDNITLSLLDENLDYLDLNGEHWSISLAFTFIPITKPPIAEVPQYAQGLLGRPPTEISQRIQQAYQNLMQAQQEWQQNIGQLSKKAKKKGRGRRKARNALQQQISNPPRPKPVLAAIEGGEPRGQSN